MLNLMQLIVIIVLAFFQSCKSRTNRSDVADFSYKGAGTYKDSVDLSNQFHDEIQKQTAGSCHVHAAVALVEAACYRAIGKKIKISEDYAFYRHLRTETQQMNWIDPQKVKDLGIKSLNQGGVSINSIKRIFNGSVCTKEEYDQFSAGDFVEYLKNAIAAIDSPQKEILDQLQNSDSRDSVETRTKLLNAYKKSVGKRMPENLCTTMDQSIICLNDQVSNEESGVVIRTIDPDLRKCLQSHLSAKMFETNARDRFHTLLLEYMKAEIPVLCGTYIRYRNGVEGPHAIVVAGYTRDKNSKNGLILRYRDSNQDTMSQGEGGCRDMTVITQGSEKFVE